jgi:hypothetical protein
MDVTGQIVEGPALICGKFRGTGIGQVKRGNELDNSFEELKTW